MTSRAFLLLAASLLFACGARTPTADPDDNLLAAAGSGGSASNGSAGNGSAGNGSAGNGSAGNGSAGNGSAGSGSAGNGSAGNGSAGNGSAGNGSAGNGSAGGPALPPDVACWEPTIDLENIPFPFPKTDVSVPPCDLVGTWDVVSGAQPLAISFSPTGYFVAGPVGSDLCLSADQEGQWAAGGKLLYAWNRKGKVPGCALGPNGEVTYFTKLSADCSKLTLSVQTDSCTGGGLFAGGGTLKKR